MSEVQNIRIQNDRLKLEKNALEQEVFETQQTLMQTQSEFSKLQENSRREIGLVMEERKMNEHIVEELSREVTIMPCGVKLAMLKDPLLTLFQLESLKSASFPRGLIPSSLGVEYTSNSSPTSLIDEVTVAGLNTTNHINDLEDEIRTLREKNKKLRVNFFESFKVCLVKLCPLKTDC